MMIPKSGLRTAPKAARKILIITGLLNRFQGVITRGNHRGDQTATNEVDLRRPCVCQVVCRRNEVGNDVNSQCCNREGNCPCSRCNRVINTRNHFDGIVNIFTINLERACSYQDRDNREEDEVNRSPHIFAWKTAFLLLEKNAQNRRNSATALRNKRLSRQ